MGFKYKDVASPDFHILNLDQYPPSVANLPAALTINGQTVYPTFRYNGRDANATNWPAWGYGETLTLVGSYPLLNQGSPLLGSVDSSVALDRTSGITYYQASNTSFSDLTTEDVVIEMIIRRGSGGASTLGLAKVDAYTGAGWYCLSDKFASATLEAKLTDGTDSVSPATSAIALGAWCHIMIFCNRDENSTNGCVIYSNGVAGTGVNAFAVGSMTCAEPFTIGADSNGALGSFKESQFAAMSFYKLNDWHQAGAAGPAEWATVAKTRFAQLAGVYPQQARGTALPTVMTRSTAAYLDKIEADGTTKLYYVGPNWPRVCSRKDAAGNVVRGYLSETAATNYLLYCNDLNQWAAANCTVGATSVACPDGVARTTVELVESTDVGAVTHYMRKAGGMGAAGVMSGYVKASGRSQLRAVISDGGQTFYAVYDLTTLAVSGATGGATIARITGTVGGWLLWELGHPSLSVAGNLYLEPAVGGTQVYQGDGRSALYLSFNQAETGVAASSRISTATAAVTRTADSLRYKMDDGNLAAGKGSLVLDFMGANVDLSSGGSIQMNLSDGSAVNRMYLGTGDNVSTFVTTAAGEAEDNISGTTDIWDGNKHTVRATWKTNQRRLYVDGAAEGTPDTSCAIPTGLTQLDVGAYLSAGYECNGLVSNLKIFRKPSTRG